VGYGSGGSSSRSSPTGSRYDSVSPTRNCAPAFTP
jgi:hypothetical protein